jgi:hypothetical protein
MHRSDYPLFCIPQKVTELLSNLYIFLTLHLCKYLPAAVTGEDFEAAQRPKMTEFSSGFNTFNKASALNGGEWSGSLSVHFSPDDLNSGALQ